MKGLTRELSNMFCSNLPRCESQFLLLLLLLLLQLLMQQAAYARLIAIPSIMPRLPW